MREKTITLPSIRLRRSTPWTLSDCAGPPREHFGPILRRWRANRSANGAKTRENAPLAGLLSIPLAAEPHKVRRPILWVNGCFSFENYQEFRGHRVVLGEETNTPGVKSCDGFLDDLPMEIKTLAISKDELLKVWDKKATPIEGWSVPEGFRRENGANS